MTPLRRDLRHPLWATAPDEELARMHGVSSREVRELRDEMERDALSAEVLGYARHIAALTGCADPLGVIVRRCMRGTVRRIVKRQQTDDSGRSAGQVEGQAVEPKSTVGVSGRRDLRRRRPRGDVGAGSTSYRKRAKGEGEGRLATVS